LEIDNTQFFGHLLPRRFYWS